MSKENIDYEVGSGNVFADLGLPNPEERLLKARLAGMIYDVVQKRKWTQKHTADTLGISQPDVSRMLNGMLKDFSVERLINFLNKLDQRITITIQDEKENLPPNKIVIAANTLGENQPAIS